ncbi:class I adenylate-forming enzyme family protein [Rhodopseudomonas palustris]|uniref:Long-chain-fatty-acid--CoA ligase n=1 Tax=Rhodopseudomonas palustris TaxID=1076 RepID=A0A418VIZ6_RHOPL|nr:class I adenylate-forming enzyme family protein [Rhodopseudomonas palustris]RJF76085.1 long-chain fatty acid--CoA ligase [Rhodopseudomonas palustris]
MQSARNIKIRTPFIETLSDLFIRSAQWRGRDELFVDDADRITGSDAFDQARALAQAYVSAGAAPGSVVAFLCRSSARHAVAWFAAPLSGRIASSLHVRETPERLGEVLAWLGAAVLVHDADLAALAGEAIARAGRPIARISLGAGDGVADDYAAAVAEAARYDVLAAPPQPSDIAAIVLSSGTTGRPKGIMHSQKTLLEAAKGGQVTMGPIPPEGATLLYMQPSFAAWAIIVLPFVAAKAKVCFGQVFTPQAFLESVQRERISMAPLVPTMWRMVFDAKPEAYDLSSLTLVTISGEAPAPTDVRTLYDKFCRNIACIYLSGEAFTASAVIAGTTDLMQRGKIGSSGRPVVGADVCILNGSFDDVAAEGDSGEIAVSGPSLAIGYWKDPELTREKFRDGWWRSGDLGRLDADGFLWVTGRIDNVINSGGIKVSGEEIEHALLTHPAVAQCAVVGQPDAAIGQRIEAFIVPRGDLPPAAELGDYLRRHHHFAGFKVPKHFHAVPELPTGPTGKLFRRALRAP